MYVIKTEEMKVPLMIFSTEGSIEEQCIEQMKKVSSLPFLHHHVALMPDGHLGIGASIGSVVATNDVVIPSLVGVDIGCGMCAVRTTLTELDTDTLKKIMGQIRQTIPVGFAHHQKKQDLRLMPEGGINSFDKLSICGQEFENALTQIGTLGGGNHFIEIQKGSDGHIWVMIHSGSRNLGLKVATYYNKLAVNMNTKWYGSVPTKWELAYLPLDSEEGENYLTEMKYCVEFALANRSLMMERVTQAIADNTNQTGFDEMINIAHNYATMENHFGKNVMIHRKGATKADKGLIGIIPGSMGTTSYIVEGLGNEQSFKSCSHGAGRRMGRKQAIATLDLFDEQKKMEGILGAPRNQNDLDEAPGSYKDILDVMKNQIDLVKPIVELSPLGVIKG